MSRDSLHATQGQTFSYTAHRERRVESGRARSVAAKGHALPPEVVELCRDIYAGADFLTLLCCSAVCNGTGFQHACRSLSILPSVLNSSEQRRIDATMAALAGRALRHGRSPIPLSTAQTWLRSILHRSIREIEVAGTERGRLGIAHT